MQEKLVSTTRVTNVTDTMAPFFAGNTSIEDATKNTLAAFITAYEMGSFICSVCGHLIFPEVTTNEHGIFVYDVRNEVRGGFGNKLIKKNICEKCARELISHSSMNDYSMCDTCVHTKVCRFEVPVGETCNYYMKG